MDASPSEANAEDGSSGYYGEADANGTDNQEQEQQDAHHGQTVEVKVKGEQQRDEGMRTVDIAVSEDVREKEKTLLTYKRRCHTAVATPKVETSSPRPVRSNRGIKRRFPGDESDDGEARKPVRVRSMTEVFAESARYTSDNSGKAVGENGSAKRIRGKKKGKQSRANGTRKVVLRGVNGNEFPDQRQGNVYVCNHEGCDKVFAEAGALYRHARVHGDRPYVCHYEGCNRRFLERSKLKRHYLIHTGEKSFICGFEGCGKAFSLDFNLRSHMKTHTGDYHECPHEGCEKKYCQNYKLRAHMCKDHNIAEGDARLEALKETSEMKAAKRQEKLTMLVQKKEKLDKWRDGRKKRICELEVELEKESKELGKINKALKKINRVKDNLDEDEEEEEEEEEEDESEDTSSSAEDEEMVEPDMEQADDKEMLVFATTVDQGARLVQADARMVALDRSSDEVLVRRPSTTTTTTTTTASAADLSGSSSVAKLDTPSSGCSAWQLQSQQEQEQQQQQQQQQQGQQQGNGQVNCSNNSSSVNSNNNNNSINSNSNKLLLLQQNELPVAHLFSFQEQPCLVD